MQHKVSQLVEKINAIHNMAQRLYTAKYMEGANKQTIDHMIDGIRAECFLVANDTQEYMKVKDCEERKDIS